MILNSLSTQAIVVFVLKIKYMKHLQLSLFFCLISIGVYAQYRDIDKKIKIVKEKLDNGLTYYLYNNDEKVGE